MESSNEIKLIIKHFEDQKEYLKNISGAYRNKHNELIEIFVYYRACVEMIQKLEILKKKCEEENKKLNFKINKYNNKGKVCVESIVGLKNEYQNMVVKKNELKDEKLKKEIDKTLKNINIIFGSKKEQLSDPLDCLEWKTMIRNLLDIISIKLNIGGKENDCCEEVEKLKKEHSFLIEGWKKNITRLLKDKNDLTNLNDRYYHIIIDQQTQLKGCKSKNEIPGYMQSTESSHRSPRKKPNSVTNLGRDTMTENKTYTETRHGIPNNRSRFGQSSYNFAHRGGFPTNKIRKRRKYKIKSKKKSRKIK
jgi:hypothetical protein